MKISRILPAALLGMALLGMLAAAGIYFYVLPQLPATDTLRDVRFQVPLRIYSADERLIAEFGEKRRIPVKYENLPPRLVQAFLAAEDDRFFEHPGVDYQGLIRAALQLIRTGRKTQGGSTITMQVARNFFLSREKTYLRKLTEILLALKIERELSKEQILELYLNKIYLGQRAYGVAAAARIYYGTDLDGLTLAQMAMIAGLPKAPSRDNPVSNPERARTRRDYVLRRMRELDYI
ncbi:MAG TPA: peptidase, partial [Thiotrichales bacterium]|nr:peptidase [Thiotrichales bacterium]